MEPDFNHKPDGPDFPFNQGPTPSRPQPQKPNTLSALSLTAGILGLISCCVPPLQLLIGAAAIMLAVVSKKGRPFSGLAVAGLILGILSVICSILMFVNFAITMQFMQDPANAEIMDQIMEQYQTLFGIY